MDGVGWLHLLCVVDSQLICCWYLVVVISSLDSSPFSIPPVVVGQYRSPLGSAPGVDSSAWIRVARQLLLSGVFDQLQCRLILYFSQLNQKPTFWWLTVWFFSIHAFFRKGFILLQPLAVGFRDTDHWYVDHWWETCLVQLFNWLWFGIRKTLALFWLVNLPYAAHTTSGRAQTGGCRSIGCIWFLMG